VNVADAVRESLEKHPSERTDFDVETILSAIQHLQVCHSALDLSTLLKWLQGTRYILPKNCLNKQVRFSDRYGFRSLQPFTLPKWGYSLHPQVLA